MRKGLPDIENYVHDDYEDVHCTDCRPNITAGAIFIRTDFLHISINNAHK